MAFTDKQAAFRYINEYQKDKYDRITILVPKGKKEEYANMAKARGKSLSGLIADLLEREEKETNVN